MHILFTAYEFVTERKPCGGFGHYLANIATILSEHGHKVTILLLTDHNCDFEWKRNVRVIAFKYEYVSKGLHIEKYIDQILDTDIAHYVNKSLAFQIKIKEIHKQNKIDIIQHNGDHLEAWHRNWKIPTVIRLSSFTPWCDQAYNPHSDMEDMRWLESWKSKLFIYPMKKVDAVYGPSKCVAGFLSPKLPQKVKVIESPFLLDEEKNGSTLPEVLIGKKYFLFFGRICVLKGINTIIAAIHQILEENPEYYFVFAGNPEQKGMIQRLLNAAGEYKERVLILGEIKDKVVMQEIIRHAYVCVLPSRAENLANACKEAMGLGKIVIGTHGASFEQLIQNKKSGLLIKRDSPKALLSAIRYLNSMTPEMKLEMEKLAMKRIEKMQPELIYQKVMELYKSVIIKKCGGK